MDETSQKYAAIGKTDLEMGLEDAASIESQHKLGFIRKVYGILSFQLVLTTVVTCLMVFTPSITRFVLTHSWPVWLAFALSIVLLIALYCYKQKHPTNLILLTVWTFVMSYTVGVVCAAYSTAGMGGIVLEALVLTMSVFIGLTIFTFQSKIDFSFLGAGLYSALWILVFWGIIQLMFGVHGGVAGMLYSLFGAIIFSLYIIFDTYMLINKFGYDDYILAAINLYLDIINLFLYILSLLSSSSSRD